jgi:hypothetical protein
MLSISGNDWIIVAAFIIMTLGAVLPIAIINWVFDTPYAKEKER